MTHYPRALLAVVAVGLVVSHVNPYDRTTRWMEIFPILLGVPLDGMYVAATYIHA